MILLVYAVFVFLLAYVEIQRLDACGSNSAAMRSKVSMSHIGSQFDMKSMRLSVPSGEVQKSKL